MTKRKRPRKKAAKKVQGKLREERGHPRSAAISGGSETGRRGFPWWWMSGALVVVAVAAVIVLPRLRGEGPGAEAGNTASEPGEIPQIADLDELDPRMAEAVRGAVAALERSPDDGDRWGRLGRIYHAHEFFELAQQCYRQALALDAGNLDWSYLLGLLAAERGRNSEAIHLLEPVVARNRTDVAAAHHLGNALLAESRLDEAAQVFAGLENAPQPGPWGALGLARVEMRRERWPQALARLEEARRLDPDNRETLFQLATVYRELGRSDEAAALFQRTESLPTRSPPDPRMTAVAGQRRDLESLISRGNRLLEERRVEEAESLYRQVLAYDPDHFDAHFDLGVLLGRTGRLPEALEEMKEAARIRPDSAQAERGLGTAYLEIGQPELALPHLRRAFEFDPSDPDLARYLSASTDVQ